jgi:twitching motility two-component system response regulator PilH
MHARTILFIGDILEDLKLERTFLERQDVAIVGVKHGTAAVARAKLAGPELVVIDVSLPDLAGIDTCRTLKTDPATKKIPAVLVTSPDRAERCRSAGADSLVFKPLAQEEVLRAIRRFVALPERAAPRCAANLRFTFQAEGEPGQAFSRSLSSSGAYLKTDRPMRSGEHLFLRFHIPGDEREISCSGIVRNTTTEEAASISGPGFGVEFLEIARVDRDRLERYVRSQA